MTNMIHESARSRSPWIRRKRHWIPLGVLAAGLVMAVFAYVSPWPSVWLLRLVFDNQARETVAEMDKYAPTDGIDWMRDVQYADGGTNTQFDIFSPSASSGPLPTVIWVHGGAWVSGDKEIRDPYARILAAEGYTVASLNYTVAPDATYPTAVTELNEAFGYIVDHAAELRVDPDRIVLAGDSAGGQLVSQLATIITSQKYASEVGITPTLSPDQVRGVILNCGVYDVKGIPDIPGIFGWGFRVALWAYIGTKDWSNTPGDKQMSTIDDVTADFPTTWISGGNGDALTATQSKPMAAQLKSLGVDVTELFFPDDTTPALAHEYQFHLDNPNAQKALTSTLGWLAEVTK
jgi:acetyl esterase/lipase